MASWNSRRKAAAGDMVICLIIGIVAALFFLSAAFRDAGATTATSTPAETVTMSATWWVATPTPIISVTFAPTATPPTQPTATAQAVPTKACYHRIEPGKCVNYLPHIRGGG